jgi:hypothetical protein
VLNDESGLPPVNGIGLLKPFQTQSKLSRVFLTDHQLTPDMSCEGRLG